ncbi:hypothetical protein RHGRI_030734 [Rhododendron griersonianum]|uniref:Uncharacterized protein n=1 Tax=Rhododendron griersonianum TaxID=479676 RepID=A0AAV6I5X8_9ERIC|nr:hypothetical protein RHGRI_030734 [Rhododendron griersonianum]
MCSLIWLFSLLLFCCLLGSIGPNTQERDTRFLVRQPTDARILFLDWPIRRKEVMLPPPIYMSKRNMIYHELSRAKVLHRDLRSVSLVV